MLGIEDPWVATAYILSIGSALLCIIYGLFSWNRGDDSVTAEDVQWVAHDTPADEAD
jgi:hypothetical protein